jgi:hypothetical protein
MPREERIRMRDFGAGESFLVLSSEVRALNREAIVCGIVM